MTPFFATVSAAFAAVSLLALRAWWCCPANDLRSGSLGFLTGAFAVLAVGAGVAAYYGGTP